MTIGNRIKNRRIELGLSVDEVAEKLGKNRATIYRYESDDIKGLPITVLEPLASALETTPADLMGYSNDETDNNNHLELTKKDERDIAKDLNSIMEKLSNSEYGPAAFDGEEIPEDDRELFAGQLELMLRKLKTINKEKYNPNKNKK